MRTIQRLAGAVSAMIIGLSCVPNATEAATSCEDLLSSSYQCTYVADDHTSGPFGATVTNPVLGDGLFDLLIGGVYLHHCTCSESGPPLAPAFGKGKKYFFCNQGTTGSMGMVKKGSIVGQTYNTAGAGQRTVYVCTTGTPPPPPPSLAGYCCELPVIAPLPVDSKALCLQTMDPTGLPCTVTIANQACSGNGVCSPSPKPGACCDFGGTLAGIPCLTSVSATSCASLASGGVHATFHDNAICTVSGCTP